MGYVITKQPDGDVSLGSLNGEFVSLSDSASDYATGGYAIIGGEAGAAAPNTINCDLWRVITAIPVGNQQGIEPVWNANTGKVQMYWNGTANGPAIEVPNGTDLSGYSFNLLLIGN